MPTLPKWTVLDFETFAIQPRPNYPPKPVGFAEWLPGQRKGTYHSWGHPTGNNCTQSQGEARLRAHFNGTEPLLFHESKFDIEVGVAKVPRTRMPSWQRTHDTKYMLFYQDPYAANLSLKPSAERLLDIKPEERDELKEWILKHIKESTAGTWGAYIAMAPGDLVGRYAIGDVYRTKQLGNNLWKTLNEFDMHGAYDRDRHLMPILLENEQLGMHVDGRALESCINALRTGIGAANDWLRKRLKQVDLNIDSDAKFAQALVDAKVVKEEDFAQTKTGKRSTSKKTLTPQVFKDKRVFAAYSYQGKASTCLGTFAEPWYVTSQSTGGTIHTTWRQMKGSMGGRGTEGAGTGRMQSSPNFQNIPKNFNKKDPNYIHPDFLNIAPLPLMRQFLVPDAKDHVWGRRDYNQQELRILGHFENGSLMQNYLDNPRFDLHTLVQQGVQELIGILFERDRTKAVNFQDIYGGGMEATMRALDCDRATAERFKQAKRALMPDVAALELATRNAGKAGLTIRTWGGREYYTEPPSYSEKFQRPMTYEYKLLNYLIQGSAADCTKEALIRYYEHPKREGRILVAVHDEINISAHKSVFKQEMATLREAMQSVEFDIPMLSDGEFGPNWGTLAKFEEPELARRTIIDYGRRNK